MLQYRRLADTRIATNLEIARGIERRMNSSDTFGTREGDITNVISDVRQGIASSFGESRPRG